MKTWIRKCPLPLRWAGGIALLAAAVAYEPAISQSTGFNLPYAGSAPSDNAPVAAFTNASTTGPGSHGVQAMTNSTDPGSVGLLAYSAGGSGVYGYANADPTTTGVYGLGDGGSGSGVYGQATTNYGVYGSTAGTNSGTITAAGVFGTGSSSTAVGVMGTVTGTNFGVYGVNNGNGPGVRGHSNSNYGVFGSSGGTNPANSVVTAGVMGVSGTATGVGGFSNSATDVGVYGSNSNASGGVGVYGQSAGSYGVSGTTSQASASGIYGTNTGGGAAIIGSGNSAGSPTGYFYNASTGSSATGLQGQCNAGNGVTGYGTVGVYGITAVTNGNAGYFQGNLRVTGTVYGAAKSFLIDHPQDPANKYLVHSCIESSERLNLYTGDVTLDSDGKATVQMPDWFQAENTRFHYQLTAIGDAAPSLHIAQKIQDNRFAIAGGKPGMEVSWQVTGTRQDAYALAHPLVVEPEKTGAEKGKYLHPLENGHSLKEGIGISAEEIATPRCNLKTIPPRKLSVLAQPLAAVRLKPVAVKRPATKAHHALR